MYVIVCACLWSAKLNITGSVYITISIYIFKMQNLTQLKVLYKTQCVNVIFAYVCKGMCDMCVCVCITFRVAESNRKVETPV